MEPWERAAVLAIRTNAAHALGDIPAARADFASATELEGKPLYSQRGSSHARHHVDLGDLATARALCDHGLGVARANSWNNPRFHALLARIDLAEGRDATPRLDEVRDWTSRTGDMKYIIEAHLLTARHLLAKGDPQAALGEAEAGLLHAVSCGYGLLRIELLVAMARIRLAWPDAPKAIQAAREALDLAAHTDCQYAWGERMPRRPGARPTSPTMSPRSQSARLRARSRCSSASSTRAPPRRSGGSPAPAEGPIRSSRP